LFEWKITVTWDDIVANNVNVRYDGGYHWINVYSSVGIPTVITYSDAYDGTYTSERPEFRDVGTYIVWFELERDGDTNGPTQRGNAQVTITKADLYVTATADSKEFGGIDPTFGYNVTPGPSGVGGWMPGDDKTLFTGELGRIQGVNAGKYAITLNTLSAGGNYTIVFTSADFEITAKKLNAGDLTIGAVGPQKYTGSQVRPLTTVEYGSVIFTAGTHFDYDYANNINVGKAAELIVALRGNYSGSVTVLFEIYLDIVSLTGTVTHTVGSNDIPIPGAAVHYEIHEGRSFTPRSIVSTDADGKYTITAPGNSTVRILDVIHNEYLYVDGVVSITMTSDQTKDMKMHPCFMIYLGTIGPNAAAGEIQWSTGTGFGVLTSGGTKFRLGTEVYLQAVGSGNNRLSYWTGDIGGNNNTYLYDKNVNITIGAVFYDSMSGNTFRLNLGAIDLSEGRIMWSVGLGIKTELTSEGVTFTNGTLVIVEAVGVNDFKLSYWTGSLGGNINPERIITYATIGAVFYDSDDSVSKKYFSLDLDGTVNGGKIMWSVDLGIPAELTSYGAKFPIGTNVILEAVANSGYTFTMWTDDKADDPEDPVRILIMNDDYYVNALFERHAADDLPWLWIVLAVLFIVTTVYLIIFARKKNEEEEEGTG
jgi:hypothetical protein